MRSSRQAGQNSYRAIRWSTDRILLALCLIDCLVGGDECVYVRERCAHLVYLSVPPFESRLDQKYGTYVHFQDPLSGSHAAIDRNPPVSECLM